ncbi:MAG: FecR domain-containing protein [Nitrospirota bacterium]
MSLKTSLFIAGHCKHIALCIGLITFLLNFHEADSAVKEAGNIKDIKGTANILREKKTIEARKNDSVFGADTVKTFNDSRIKILFIDDSLLMIGENSSIAISEYLKETGKKDRSSVFNLMDGVLNVIVGKSAFEVHTPTAVTASRGTSYVVWVEKGPKQKTGMVVTEGRVEVRNKEGIAGEKVVVSAGKMSYVEEGKPPTPAVVAPPEVIQVFYKKTLAPDERWGPVILKAKGSALPPPGVSPVQSRLMALRAAKVEALRNLLEQVYGVTIVSNSSVEDFALKNDTIKSGVDAFIKGAWVSEERLLADGSYEVEMEIGLGIGFRRMFLEQEENE